jgi:hypothetical protein
MFRCVLLAFVLTEFAATPAYAAEPAGKVATSIALQPYLGKWRPTSYSEGLNIGSLTISEDSLSLEANGSSLSFVVEQQLDEGVIVRVTGRNPTNAFPKVTALGFSVRKETVTGPPPEGVTKARELLWICYWSNSIDRLALEIKKASCGNAYTR